MEMKRIFFVSIRTFFLMSQGDCRTQDRPGKKFFGEEVARGRTQLLSTKGGLSLARRKTRVQTDASQFSRFSAGIKKGGEHRCSPQR